MLRKSEQIGLSSVYEFQFVTLSGPLLQICQCLIPLLMEFSKLILKFFWQNKCRRQSSFSKPWQALNAMENHTKFRKIIAEMIALEDELESRIQYMTEMVFKMSREDVVPNKELIS